MQKFNKKMLVGAVFAMCLANMVQSSAAEKTITAHIAYGTTLGTKTIGQAATTYPSVVVDTLEGNPNTVGPEAKFTYKWTYVSTNYRSSPAPTAWGASASEATMPPGNNSTITSISTIFSQPGYYRVKFKVEVSFTSGTGIDTWKSVPLESEVEQTVIGGDFTEVGTKNLRFYCGAPVVMNPPATVTAPLQPVGTSWTWTTSTPIHLDRERPNTTTGC